MKTYHAYIIHKVLAFSLFLAFFPLATVALILMVADVSPQYRGMLLFFLLWPVVTYMSYCLAIYLAAGKREISIHDGGLGIREVGKVFRGSHPVLQIAIRDIGDAQTVYGSVGCVSLTLNMANGSKMKLSRRLAGRVGARGFDEMVLAVESLLAMDATGKIEGATAAPAPEVPVITCKSRIDFITGLYLGSIVPLLNIGLVIGVFSTCTFAGKALLDIAFVILFGVAEAAFVTWVVMLLVRSRLSIAIYKNKVVVRQLKNYIIQRYRVNEVYYNSINRYITMWTRGSDQKTIKFTDKRGEVYIIEEFSHIFNKYQAAEYQVEQHLTAALKQFIAENGTEVEFRLYELEPDNG